MSDVIASDIVVTIDYTLKDDDGDVIDTSIGDQPLSYLHGHQNIVPGLEKQLDGKKVGDKVEVVVTPEEGYGDRDEDGVRSFPREAFPEGVDIGMQFMAESDDHDLLPIWVINVEEDTVYADTNHPLAGENLHFDVTIVELRAAKPEELEHGHPHGRHGDAGHQHSISAPKCRNE